jgi:hypothetical protein
MRRSFMNHGKAMMGRVARILLSMLCFGLVLISPCAVQAQTWTGSASNLWNNPNNWTPNGVPNSGTANVNITGSTNNSV